MTAEQRFRILDGTLEGCQIVDSDYTYVYVNQAACEQFRKTKDELIGHTMPDVWPGIEGTPLFGCINACLADGKSQQLLNEFTFPDGAVGWFQLRMSPVDEGVLIFSIDVTEERIRERKLGFQNSATELLFHISAAANSARSISQVFQVAVDELCIRFGFDVGHAFAPGGALPQHIDDLRVWYLADPVRYAPFRRATEDLGFSPDLGGIGEVLHGKQCCVLHDLSSEPVFQRHRAAKETGLQDGFFLPAFSGIEVVAVVELFASRRIEPEELGSDLPYQLGLQLGRIVERTRASLKIKEAQKELERANADLERKVAERTRGLQVANEELEAFSYSVSHDLRSPLRAIDGFGSALEEDYWDSLDGTARDYLHRIRSETSRMARLIDDLLSLSRLTRRELSLQWIDMSALCEEVVSTLAAGDPGRSIEVTIEPGITVCADKTMVRAVMQNLLGNAWKFTSKSLAPRIEVGMRLCEGDRFVFVRDNGAGFDPRYADKLFGVFQRLHNVAEFPGTGIGLATVKRIVTRHHGRIEADGAVGTGAEFRFFLPGSACEDTPDEE